MSLQLVADIHRVAGRLAMTLESGSQVGGSASDILALAILYENDNCDIASLVHQLGVAPSTLSSLLKRLEKKKYIDRCSSTLDRRKFDLVLTPEGRRAAEIARQAVEAIEDRMTDGLSYGLVIAFSEVVEILEKVLAAGGKQAPGRSASPR